MGTNMNILWTTRWYDSNIENYNNDKEKLIYKVIMGCQLEENNIHTQNIN